MDLVKFGYRVGLIVMITVCYMIPAGNAQPAIPGKEIYLKYCSTCHGADLKGGAGSSLVDGEWKFGSERSEIATSVKEGIPAQGMPAFGRILSDQEIRQVIDYIRSVASSEEESGATATVDTLQSLDYQIRAVTYVDNLEIPWAIDFLDANTAIITERPGRVRIAENGTLRGEPVSGTPQVLHAGQGGLLDVTVDPDFAENGWIYLSYSHVLEPDRNDSPAMTRIVRGRIDDNQWVDQQVLFEAPHETYRTTRHHYGSRIVFDREGFLFFSIGDRGAGEQAQDLSRPNGKVHRINRDGSIPDDNPFINREEALPSVFSYGHRNPQGLAVDPETGNLWDAEHGPRGGDELNLVVAGSNYGWPEISYGINYNGTVLTRDRQKQGMKQPNFYWRPSIAVSGIAFYDGNQFPYWKTHLLVGALRDEEVRLLNIEGVRVIHEEVILKDRGRVREAVTGPDGAIYVVLNEPGKILRLSLEKESIR